MKICLAAVIVAMLVLPVSAQVIPKTYDFTTFEPAPVNGQNGWEASGAQIVLLSDEGDAYAGYDYTVARVGNDQSMNLSGLNSFPIPWDSAGKFYSAVVSFDVMFSATYLSLLDAGYTTGEVGSGQLTMFQFSLARDPYLPGSNDTFVLPFYQGLELRVNGHSVWPLSDTPRFYEPLLAQVWYHMELVVEWITGENEEEQLMAWMTVQPENGTLWKSEPMAILFGDPYINHELLRFNFMGQSLAGLDTPYYLRSLSVGPLVPEPATMSLLALGGLAMLRRKKAT